MIIVNNGNDSISIYDIVLGNRVKQTYYYYSMETAKRMFKEYRKEYIKREQQFINQN